MAPAKTGGPTKEKKVKATAKAKKNGKNGNKTVTLVLDSADGGTPTVSSDTVSTEEYNALKKQMTEILAKFGPVLKAAEQAGAQPVVPPVEPDGVAGVLAKFAESEASTVSSTEIVPPQPKKKYTKKPKGPQGTVEHLVGVSHPVSVEPQETTVTVSVVPASESENPPFAPVVTAEQVVSSEPKMAGPAPGLMFGVDLAKGASKSAEVAVPISPLAQQFAAAAIAVASSPLMEKLPLVGPDGSVQLGSQTPPQGTGGDLLLTTDGTPALVDGHQMIVEKVAAALGVPAAYLGVAPPPPKPTPKKKVPVQAKTTATVTKQFGKDPAKQDVTEETIAVHTFLTQPAVVGVECGLTMNLGNYESARITVSISVPCYAEERDAAYNEACKWVEERITKQRDAIMVAKTTPGF